MSKQVTIANTQFNVIEYQGQRVVTLGMIDQVHQRPEGTAKRNFHENRNKLVEGEDFIELTADEIRTQSLTDVFPPRTPKGIVIFESGYLMLVKSFQDDLAWQVQRQLVNGYFKAKDDGYRLEPEPIVRPHKSVKVNTDAARSFKAFFSVAKMLGLDKNAAAISANQATIKTMGTNMLALLENSHLEASNQESLAFTPSELGLRMGISGMKFNLLLEKNGFQTKVGKDWMPTESARGYYRLYDTGKKHNSGAPVQQVKWLDSVLPLVQQAA
ncbi:KilA-N DNA-binding domain-containing protein [Gammaproteobacteria bacterium]